MTKYQLEYCEMLSLDEAKIANVGLGYVGLPLTVEFSIKIPVIGFGINKPRKGKLNSSFDSTLEVSKKKLLEVMLLSCASKKINSFVQLVVLKLVHMFNV